MTPAHALLTRMRERLAEASQRDNPAVRQRHAPCANAASDSYRQCAADLHAWLLAEMGKQETGET
jgi:hypothetical protein